ncbi:hypothetical protein [Corynebacterium liangguodongii]|uniref:hypothetical protein n=1 Tax=Corynebacterium liangguodongii TaxID=2079535 RepID=UPI0011B2485A|nr:hypothetical protein [Corynebacterium liangguodongii]
MNTTECLMGIVSNPSLAEVGTKPRTLHIDVAATPPCGIANTNYGKKVNTVPTTPKRQCCRLPGGISRQPVANYLRPEKHCKRTCGQKNHRTVEQEDSSPHRRYWHHPDRDTLMCLVTAVSAEQRMIKFSKSATLRARLEQAKTMMTAGISEGDTPAK